MNEVVIPLFKSHYSIGRSILTLEKPEDMIQNGPDSIIQIAKEHKLDQVFLIEDSMSGFLQAYKNLQEENIKLILLLVEHNIVLIEHSMSSISMKDYWKQ